MTCSRECAAACHLCAVGCEFITLCTQQEWTEHAIPELSAVLTVFCVRLGAHMAMRSARPQPAQHRPAELCVEMAVSAPSVLQSPANVGLEYVKCDCCYQETEF